MSIDAATLESASATRPPVRMSVSRESGGEELSNVNTELSFGDLLDAINPLQHIPIVGTLYRAITGDTIQPAARAVGGILYGGPIGGIAAVANAIVEQINGKDVGDQIMASLGLGPDDPSPTSSAGSPNAAPVKAAATAVAGLPAQPPAPQGQGNAPQAAAAGPTGSQPIRLAASGPVGPAPAGNPAVQADSQAAAQKMAAEAGAANSNLVAQLAGQDGQPFSRPSRMSARDTNLANTMQAKHMASRVAPMPGSTASLAAGQPANAQQVPGAAAATGSQVQTGAQPGVQTAPQGGFAAVTPDRLSETMMRNLSKYEQSRRAGQAAPAAVRVSG